MDLSEHKLSPEAVVALVRTLPPSLTSLAMTKCDVAKGGADSQGVAQLGLALRNPQCKLKALDLRENKLGVRAAQEIASGLKGNRAVLTTLKCAFRTRICELHLQTCTHIIPTCPNLPILLRTP